MDGPSLLQPGRRLALGAAVVAVAAALLIITAGRYLGPERPWVRHTTETGRGTVQVGGPFDLVDQDGRPVTDRDFRGRLMLVYFGYTWCPDMCPTTLQVLGQAMDALGAAGDQVAFLFISVDPGRDTPARLKEYVGDFGPHLRGLTGSTDQIDRAAKAYRVYYRLGEHEAGGDYPVDHTGFVYLMGRDGRYLSLIRPDETPDDIAAKIRQQL